jgi:hypothetical protein
VNFLGHFRHPRSIVPTERSPRGSCMYRAHVAVLQRASHEIKRQKRLIRADSVGSPPLSLRYILSHFRVIFSTEPFMKQIIVDWPRCWNVHEFQ